MESSIDLSLLIKMSLSSVDEEREQATEQLMQLIKNPDSIILFLQFFEDESDIENKNNCLIYIQKIVDTNWKEYNEQMKNSLIEKFNSFIKTSKNSKIAYSFANIYSIIYSITKESEIIEAVLSSENNEFIFYWFARSINDIPNELLQNNMQKFVELAQWGFSQPKFSHFPESASIYMNIVQLTHDQEIFEPVCQYLIDILPEEPNFPNNFELKNNYWSLVDELFHEKIFPIELFSQFLAAIPKSTIPLEAINWFSDIISLLSKEVLVELLQLDVELIANSLENDHVFPEDSFPLFENTIIQTGQRQLISDLISALLESDESHQLTGIYLLIPIISSTPVTSNEEVNFIFECLQNALKSPSQMFQEAAFQVINKFEDSSPELVSFFPSLIELTSHHITSPDITIRSLAYAAMISLLNECDKEIEGLLPAVWELLSNGQVQDEMLSSFMEVVSLLIRHSEDLEDDVVDSILEWLEAVFNDEEKNDISNRASALMIIAALISNEESMCDSLLPLCQVTVEEAFKSENDDAIRKACVYLDTISVTFKARSGKFISPFVQNLSDLLKDEKYKLTVVNTSSYYTGYSGDTKLLEEICLIILNLLKSDEGFDLDCGCSCLVSLSRVLKENPIALEFYRLVIRILLTDDDGNILQDAFKAAKSLFKRCRFVDEEQFNSLTYDFLSKMMSGEMVFLDGEPPYTTSKMDNFMQEAMIFLGCFFQSKPENTTQICMSLIEWMKQTNEDNVFAIIGALVDALEFCQVEDSVPIEMCTYVQANAKTIKTPDLQQNICYFLAILCRNFPQQLELVQQVMPCVISWWEKALSKKSGYQDVLANIASLFFSYFLLDKSFDENLIVGALRQFPISADLDESETMVSSMISIFEKNRPSENILIELALAFARLFTESQSQIEARKISEEVFNKAIAVFKDLMQIEKIYELVLSKYQNRKAKRQQLIQLISE